MSEPSANLDLTALSDALGDEDRQALANVSKKADAAEQGQTDSPATLSPNASSPPHVSPSATPAALPASQRAATDDVTSHPDPNVQNIKGMFPDMDIDTIQAVLVADGGNFEQAINTLLQMSDPTYVAPPPFQQLSQQDQDEQLARSIAAQEEHESARHQPAFPSSRGGLGSFFGGGQPSPASPSPTYDQSRLNYQPRIKRTMSGQQPYQARQQAPVDAPDGNESAVTGWPGPKEAKVWQEDINKLAETGFAKAASTFSALRQRGERAFAGVSQPQGNGQGPGSGDGAAAQRQPTSNLNWSSRRPATVTTGASVASPTIGSNRGFDQDPSPVGDNELAKILARGREEGKRPSVTERYKSVSSGSSRNASRDKGDDGDEPLGWDDAGRTGAGAGSSVAPSFEPIRISTNEGAETQPKAKLPSTPRNAVSLMEGSAGRGLTSPQRTSAKKNSSDDGVDDEGDDLEYVANPFEDDD